MPRKNCEHRSCRLRTTRLKPLLRSKLQTCITEALLGLRHLTRRNIVCIKGTPAISRGFQIIPFTWGCPRLLIGRLRNTRNVVVNLAKLLNMNRFWRNWIGYGGSACGFLSKVGAFVVLSETFAFLVSGMGAI